MLLALLAPVHEPKRATCSASSGRKGLRRRAAPMDRIINGNMIGGHALIAYPDKSGETGMMTVMCSHHGEVYEKNLGACTTSTTKRIIIYNPDRSWHLVD